MGNKRGRKREGPSKGNASMETEPKNNFKNQRMKIKTKSEKGTRGKEKTKDKKHKKDG